MTKTSPYAKIKILIADDHRLIRESWKSLLEKDSRIKVAGSASNGVEIIRMATEIQNDVILMDINMKPVDGFEATTQILKINPAAKIIAVSMNTAPEYLRKMMKLGALGYVNKNSGAEELIQAITTVHGNQKFYCRTSSDVLVDNFLNPKKSIENILTARELTVVGLLKEGLSSNEMAKELGIAPKTIHTHRHNILKKMNARNVAGVMNAASARGMYF